MTFFAIALAAFIGSMAGSALIQAATDTMALVLMKRYDDDE